MAIGSWRVMPERRRSAPKPPPPGYPVLTGMSEQQQTMFQKNIDIVGTLAQVAKDQLTPEQRARAESVLGRSEKDRAASGQVAKVDDGDIWP